MTVYTDFQELARSEAEGEAFRIQWRHGPSDLAVLAIHGGGIEPGTTELADAIAGKEHSYYSFVGIKRSGNWALHISSRRFDEPTGIRIAAAARAVVTVHGCGGDADMVYLGGRDEDLKQSVGERLVAAGYGVGETPRFPGRNPQNICNRGWSGKGLQLELTRRLRSGFFMDSSLRDRGRVSDRFSQFVAALREGLGLSSAEKGLEARR